MKKFFILLVGILILYADELLFKIDNLPYEEIENLQKNGIEVWEWNKDFSLCVSNEENLPENYKIEVLDKNPRDENYFIVRLLEDIDISKYKKYVKILWKKDNLLIVKDIYRKRPEDLKIRAEIKYIRKRKIKISFENLYLPVKPYFQNPIIEQMISQIDSATCYNYLKRLQNFRTRNSHHDSIGKAAQYVYNKFLEFGLDHVYYSYPGQDPWGEFKAKNIVGIKYGQTDTAFIICGHLDATAGNPYGSENVAPGADDNGSGSAGVLTAAKVMANYNFRHEIRFICFVGEEQGLIGSGTYADSCANAQSKIRGVYNMDMICHRDQGNVEDLDADDNNHLPSAYLSDTLIHFGSVYVSELPIIERHLGGGASSDHASLQEAGYPAILTIDDAVIGANPYIHSTADTIGPSANDFKLMKNSIKAIVATVAELAKVLGQKISENEKFKKINLTSKTFSKPFILKDFGLYSSSGRKINCDFSKGIYFIKTKEGKFKIIYLK